ncbi:hypothetical protein KR067_007048 [Drosophila pandora]|nr:hypothetical protein KR067_004192 [Drosophila pandora]KAH8318348.1 hypothetical protein KR067_007048 [Drosophila pandora]
MIYTDNCCFCIGLKCGCILISLIEVLIRGLDRFFVDRDSLLGFLSLVVSGAYVICCIFLLLGAVLDARCFLLPYLMVSCLRFVILVAEGIFVATEGIVNDYLIFDVLQSVLGLYFWIVVYSYYDRLKQE